MEVYETKTEVTFKLRGAPFMLQDAAGYGITPVVVRLVTFSGTVKTGPRSYVEAVGPSQMLRHEHRSKKWNVDGNTGSKPHISRAPDWIRELVGYRD
jgi:hypothetical protein